VLDFFEVIAMAHDRSYSRLTKMEVDTLIINTGVTFPGGASAISGDQTISGNLIFSAASAKIIPGATSLLIRNNADSGSNVAITNAGAVALAGASATLTITSAQAAAFAVGRLGATTPAFLIDASTSTSITGIKVKSAASAGGVAVSAIGETNVAMTIDAAGSGTISFNLTGTGNIVFGRAATGVSVSVTGALTSRSGTAVPAAASAAAALLSSSTALLGIYYGTGDPNSALTAAKGSVYFRTDGSSGSTRAYINTDGVTAWAAVTTAS
jgi:hypothetical protein